MRNPRWSATKLRDYKLILVAVGLIGILLIASPTIASSIHLPQGEPFSELYLLGPQRMAEGYPFNIVQDQDYSLYVGVGNHLGSVAYYVVYVKLLNASDPLPSDTLGTASPIQPLYEYRFAVQNEQTFEKHITFSVSKAFVSKEQSRIGNFSINGVSFIVNKPTIWNSTESVFKYQLLFELWLYDTQTELIQYHNRFVDLKLNYTIAI